MAQLSTMSFWKSKKHEDPPGFWGDTREDYKACWGVLAGQLQESEGPTMHCASHSNEPQEVLHQEYPGAPLEKTCCLVVQ